VDATFVISIVVEAWAVVSSETNSVVVGFSIIKVLGFKGEEGVGGGVLLLIVLIVEVNNSNEFVVVVVST